MSEQNREAVRRFYLELWNDWNLAVADEIVAEGVKFRGSLGSMRLGRDAFKDYVEMIRAAFPDWHNRIDEMLAVNDRVVTRMTWTGTQTGRLADIEPTGARVEYVGAAFFSVAQGIIEEAWVVGDSAAFWRALGKLRD
jgi:steroid delta-isomerase-like uncharacterized protein